MRVSAVSSSFFEGWRGDSNRNSFEGSGANRKKFGGNQNSISGEGGWGKPEYEQNKNINLAKMDSCILPLPPLPDRMNRITLSQNE